MFLFALTAPTMVVNAITMAAFRKHVLVSLIHTGTTLTTWLQVRCHRRPLNRSSRQCPLQAPQSLPVL